MNYLILYDDDCYTEIDAENLEDCIVQFADYTGVVTDLFLKALQGCQSSNDYVEMYEHFSENNINSVLLIGQTIYERGVDNEWE